MNRFTLFLSLACFLCTASLQAAPFTVTTVADENDTPSGASLSLREALRDAAASPGADTVTFDSPLSGQSIELQNGAPSSGSGASAILITSTDAVTIDASSLPGGLTLTRPAGAGGDGYRCLRVGAGGDVTLLGLRLTGFVGQATHSGGAVLSEGALTMEDCTVAGNTASGAAGAIRSQSTLTLTRCTLSGNTANGLGTGGGAIYHTGGTSTLTQCTLSGNAAPNGNGGAIVHAPSSAATLTLTHSTVAGNSAGGNGGGIFNSGSPATLTLSRSIVAGNTIGTGSSDIRNFSGTVTSDGSNLIGNNSTVSTVFPAGTPNGNGEYAGTVGTPLDALLAPLGSYGGPTQTMLPLPGSPAIDTATGSTITADQRGFPIADGDGNGSVLPDIGAAERAGTFLVSTTADSGSGSLRQALADAALQPGADTITFSPGLNEGNIALITYTNNTALTVSDSGGVTLDATALPGGLTLSANGTGFLAFLVQTGSSLTLRGLTLSGFTGQTGTDGGAIRNDGTLTMTQCTLSGNSASSDGGAIRNDGTLTLTQCTLSGNSAANGDGGAIFNFSGTLTLTQCTLSGNSASISGGAIHNSSTLTLTQCTLSGNSASSDGGAISSLGSLTLTNSIVAGNTAALGGPDISRFGAITTIGVNLLSSLVNSGLSAGPSVLVGAPLLAPLGSYGGPTKTMPPLPGSPAIDAAAVLIPAITTDQRGFPIADGDGNGSVLPDIGAAERAGTFLVSTTADSGAGSLRQALADAALQPGADTITFSPGLNEGNIALSSYTNDGFGNTALTVSGSSSVTVDATALPGGLTLSGNGTGFRAFLVQTGSSLTLRGLTLSGFTGQTGNAGGAILNFGTLTLTQCSLSGNSATDASGGAIYNGGTLTLTQSTLSGNSASDGGAIGNFGTLTLTQCTLSGNSASSGGAIENFGTLTLANSIVAGNTATLVGPDIFHAGTITATGVNLLSSLVNSGLVDDANVTVGAPLLAPLGNYGGPTPTRPPLPGSPAIDAASGTAFTADQRGFPIADGDGNGSVLPDIGAAEANAPNVVTNTNDSGLGSLRQVVADAAAQLGPDGILFHATLTGGILTLSSEIVLASSVTIDASSLAGGMTISGNNATRHFTVNSGQTVTLKNLILTGGSTPSASNGGAILNNGTLTVQGCTLHGNTATAGGAAIFNSATLTVSTSTLSNNTATGNGGAIQTAVGTTTTLAQCTLTGNSCGTGGNAGGAIRNDGALALTHCTVSGNISGGSAGGIFAGGTAITLTNCIVAENTATLSGTDLRGPTLTTYVGANIVPSVGGIGGVAGPPAITAAPQLAPLGDYGGPTQTMALLPTSPARNAAAVLSPAITTDQRGFPIVGTPDIGAYEAGTLNPNYNAYIWETLPTAGNGLITDPLHAAAFDFDSDGQTNESEWLALTNAAESTSFFRITQAAHNGTHFIVTFPTVPGRTYQLAGSEDLVFDSWTPLGSAPGTGSDVSLQVLVTGLTRSFFRVVVTKD
ncbi:MAG: hypothetical protein JNJ83_08735 [Verrucomicrobiaceae bacterium]|nr:hypothetical protein [Verrucomicrobiaceae bacterium]